MNTQWQAFLTSQGAEVGAFDTARLPGATLLPDCALSDLSHLGLVRFEGDDALSFLQGQCTNDLHHVETGERSQLNAFCTPKGRMLASFLTFRHDGAFYLQDPRDNLEPLLKRLPMFILRSKVKTRDDSDRLVRIGVSGDCAPGLLGPHFAALPAEPGQVATQNGTTALRLAADRPRFEVIGEADAIQGLWATLAAQGARPAAADHWALLDIRAGLPNIYAATREEFVPQQCNLQLVDGVNFQKGCYTGQEVVARMKYLGKLKRRMYRARSTGEAAPGMDLWSAASQSGQGGGKVVDARPSPDGGWEMLVMTEIAAVERNDVRLVNAEGAAVEFLELPYPFDD